MALLSCQFKHWRKRKDKMKPTNEQKDQMLHLAEIIVRCENIATSGTGPMMPEGLLYSHLMTKGVTLGVFNGLIAGAVKAGVIEKLGHGLLITPKGRQVARELAIALEVA